MELEVGLGATGSYSYDDGGSYKAALSLEGDGDGSFLAESLLDTAFLLPVGVTTDFFLLGGSVLANILTMLKL